MGSTWGQHAVNMGSACGQHAVNMHSPTPLRPSMSGAVARLLEKDQIAGPYTRPFFSST